MQVFVNAARTLTVDVDQHSTIASLKQVIRNREGIPAEIQSLSFGGKVLIDSALVSDVVSADSTLDLSLCLLGGAIEPTLVALARKYNQDKKICRKCYARLHPRAVNCRKKKCGHSNQLRIKKKAK